MSLEKEQSSYKITIFLKQGMTLSFVVTEEEKPKIDKYFKEKKQTTFHDADNNLVTLEDVKGDLLGRVEENIGSYQQYKNRLANNQRGQIMSMPPIIK